MRIRNGFAHIEVLVVILLVAVVGVVAFMLGNNNAAPQQTSSSVPTSSSEAMMEDEMGDWETYSDSEASFKIPSGWIAIQSPSEGDEYVVVISAPNSSGNQIYSDIQLSVNSAIDNNGNKLSLSSIDQAKEHYEQNFDTTSLSVEENYKINQHESARIQGIISSQGSGNESYLQYQFIEFPQGILIAQLSNKSLQNQFDQILSTFEFTN